MSDAMLLEIADPSRLSRTHNGQTFLMWHGTLMKPEQPAASPARRRKKLLRPSLFTQEAEWPCSLMLAMELVFIFGAVPALSLFEADRSVILIFQLVLAATAIALIARARWLKAALAITFCVTAATQLLPGLFSQISTLAMVFIYNALVTVAIAKVVFGPGEVNHHRISGAIFIYLNIALLFSLAYAGFAFANPGIITGVDSHGSLLYVDLLHFSLATLTTIGDNQMSLQTPFGRSLADLETLIGQLFPAILLSRLVGLHLNYKK